MSFNRHLTIDRVGRRAALLLAALFLALAPPGAGAAREGGAALLVTWETADGSTFNGIKNVLPDDYYQSLKVGDVLNNEAINRLTWRRAGVRQPAA